MKPRTEWPSFLKEEFRNAINKYSNLAISEPDHVLWKHLKFIVDNNKCLSNIVNITNTCIDFSYWLLYFKTFSSIIIPKPNKIAYNSLKMFWPIVLLKTLRKLIEKVIGKRLQNQSIVSIFVHPNQLSGLKQCLTTNTGIFFMYLIHSEWIKGVQTSTLAFNIA